jgi:hypothetical protein
MKELNTGPTVNFKQTYKLIGNITFLGCPFNNSISKAALSTERKIKVHMKTLQGVE